MSKMEKPVRDGIQNRPEIEANDAEPTEFRKEFAESATAFRDIAELDDLASEVKVYVTKSENMADTARQKIATVSQALDAGDFGDWNTQQWLMLRVGLGIEQVPLYLPKPGEIAAAMVTAHPEMSDRAIAKQAGVGTMTVSRARQSTVPDGTVEPRVGLDGKKRRPPASKPVKSEPAAASAPAAAPASAPASAPDSAPERVEDAIDLTRLMALATNPELFSQAERDAGVQEYARRLGVKISIAEADDQPVEKVLVVEIDDAGEREVEQDTAPVEASPEPTQPTDNRPHCPRDLATGHCRYSECNKSGVCGVSKEPIASGVLA